MRQLVGKCFANCLLSITKGDIQDHSGGKPVDAYVDAHIPN